jgi:4-carboxymuconolactone decarboxylase
MDTTLGAMMFKVILSLSLSFALGGVAFAEEQRFAPLKEEQLSPEQKAWVETIVPPPRNARFTNPPYRAYVRNVELAQRLTPLSDYLRWNTSLPARLSEMAIILTAREWSSQYEWAAHYPLAMKGGLDPSVADDIAHGRKPSKMKDDEKALYQLVTELYRNKAVSDSTYADALKHFSERGIMDVIGIIGYYDLVSMTLITMQAQPRDNSVPPLPALNR